MNSINIINHTGIVLNNLNDSNNLARIGQIQGYIASINDICNRCGSDIVCRFGRLLIGKLKQIYNLSYPDSKGSYKALSINESPHSVLLKSKEFIRLYINCGSESEEKITIDVTKVKEKSISKTKEDFEKTKKKANKLINIYDQLKQKIKDTLSKTEKFNPIGTDKFSKKFNIKFKALDFLKKRIKYIIAAGVGVGVLTGVITATLVALTVLFAAALSGLGLLFGIYLGQSKLKAKDNKRLILELNDKDTEPEDVVVYLEEQRKKNEEILYVVRDEGKELQTIKSSYSKSVEDKEREIRDEYDLPFGFESELKSEIIYYKEILKKYPLGYGRSIEVDLNQLNSLLKNPYDNIESILELRVQIEKQIDDGINSLRRELDNFKNKESEEINRIVINAMGRAEKYERNNDLLNAAKVLSDAIKNIKDILENIQEKKNILNINLNEMFIDTFSRPLITKSSEQCSKIDIEEKIRLGIIKNPCIIESGNNIYIGYYDRNNDEIHGYKLYTNNRLNNSDQSFSYVLDNIRRYIDVGDDVKFYNIQSVFKLSKKDIQAISVLVSNRIRMV
jgi:hypothetical protein